MEENSKEDIKQALVSMFGTDDGLKETVEKKPAAPEPPVAPAKVPVAAIKKPVAKPRPTPTPPSITPEERDAIVARAAVAGAAAVASKKGEDATDKITATPDLTDKQRETLEVMDFLGKKDSEYSTLVERTMNFWKAEEKYVADWKAKNPDKEFKLDDEEHAEWYEKHEPQYDDEKFASAREQFKANEIERNTLDKVRRETERKERLDTERKRQETEAETITAEVQTAEFEMIKALAPESEQHFLVDGKPVLTDAQWEKFSEEDPAAAKILRKEGDYLGRKLKELKRLDRYPNTYLPDEKNQLHVALAQLALEKEDKILALPPEQQLHEGRRFLTMAELGQKQHDIHVSKKPRAEKQAALDKLKQDYWVLNSDLMETLVIAQHRKRAGEKLADARDLEEKIKNRAARTAGNAPPKPAAEATPALAAPAVPAPAKVPARADSIPTSPGGDLMPTGVHGGGEPGGALEALTKIGI